MRRLFQLIMNHIFLSLRKVPYQRNGKSIVVAPGPDRPAQLVGLMTRKEKFDYLSGTHGFSLRAIPRLGIPAVWMSDATSGIRGVKAPITVFPCTIAMAASWNRELIRKVGAVIGSECRATGVSILLGPGVNIARVPIGGRNFEYLGEDPFLAGQMASHYIKGVQSHKVIATVKHFACNNSEYDRHKSNSVVDEKTLHELYLRAFETTVSEGVQAIMTAYNPVNGTYASEHAYLITEVLREKWQFSGMLLSDWNSLYATIGVLQNGVDVEMPRARWFTRKALYKALSLHPELHKQIDQKVLSVLTVCDWFGILDRPVVDNTVPIGTEEHRQTAKTMAFESIVLLKNEHLLPLEAPDLKQIVLVGQFATGEPIGGGGSSFVFQCNPGISLAEVLQQALPDCSIRTLTGRWWNQPQQLSAIQEASVVLAAVGFGHVYESEAYDRPWELPDYDQQVIAHITELHQRTAVMIHAGGALDFSWIHSVAAVLQCWYLGSQSAAALVDVLLGVVNPSGRLPISVGRKLNDYVSMQSYPKDYDQLSLTRVRSGQGNPRKRTIWPIHYHERMMVGYRQFDTIGPDPMFPFGYGLSYTEFSYDAVTIVQQGEFWNVSCIITNSGDRDGCEVVQLYVRQEMIDEMHPFQQLRGFEKVFIAVGQSKKVVFTLKHEDFAEYDEQSHQWIVLSQARSIAIGSSSRDIRLEVSVPHIK